MTIGIAATGPAAGLAVFNALAAIERVATGAIGGYAVFAAIDAHAVVHRAATQRGGTRTLFIECDSTGIQPPQAVANACMAAVISSGPDRPEPLEYHLPAAADAGLVTGHRLPTSTTSNGQSLNQYVLQLMRDGTCAQDAVDHAFAADPEVDAGLIAVDRLGNVYARNSKRVQQRPDLGHARQEDATEGVVVEVLHNAIFPVAPLANLAACLALDTMTAPTRAGDCFVVDAGTPVTVGNDAIVYIDADRRAIRIETTNQRIIAGRHNCAAIYLGAKVMRGDSCIGVTTFEPNTVVEAGRIVALNGQATMTVAYLPCNGCSDTSLKSLSER